uniref:Uncharacterized protein n=1 Tax=uncultured prokaryote TaxID=198431 RepID=A0A0H5Q601_9ZZZZ|nr:hypothetical protein [uncultured prokaryote]
MSIFIGIFIPVKKQHMALGRPVNKDTHYKLIVHTLGKHRYASTKVFTVGKNGKKQYTYKHWGTLEDGNRFHPGSIRRNISRRCRIVLSIQIRFTDSWHQPLQIRSTTVRHS